MSAVCVQAQLVIASPTSFVTTISPNPFTTTVTVAVAHQQDTTAKTISMLDITGKVVVEKQILSREDTEAVFNTTTLPTGVYFVETRSLLSYERKKIIKE